MRCKTLGLKLRDTFDESKVFAPSKPHEPTVLKTNGHNSSLQGLADAHRKHPSHDYPRPVEKVRLRIR